jgi:glycosyltransferase involved in cell wall biosynthesis
MEYDRKPDSTPLPRLLFIVTEDWYFVSHRLHIALAARKAGFEVGVVTRISRHRDLIERYGIEIFDWQINRRSFNLLNEMVSIRQLIEAYRRFRPSIVHHVALKPVIYGALAAKLTGVRRVVQALGGLGFIFLSERHWARALRPVVYLLLSAALSGSHTRLILQNPDDRDKMLHMGVISPNRINLIRGAGVDTTRFVPLAENGNPPIIMLPARLLWDKGVGEFVEAARCFKQRGTNARFVLIGEPDEGNPASVPLTTIHSWCADGTVEWWGQCDDMPTILSQAHVVCLPSHGEGLPKSLLEAASCARPIVTYDVPGCREVVIDGKNGFLVPFKNLDKLVEAIDTLLMDSSLRACMGVAGREMILDAFSQEEISRQTLELYHQLLI